MVRCEDAALPGARAVRGHGGAVGRGPLPEVALVSVRGPRGGGPAARRGGRGRRRANTLHLHRHRVRHRGRRVRLSTVLHHVHVTAIQHFTIIQ